MNDAVEEDEDVHYGCPSCLSVFRLGFSRCPIDGNVLQKLVDDPLVGITLADRYLIEDCIGEGGMGRVYRARHQRVSRQFAVKILFGDLSTDPKMRARFSREAEAASRLSHANVISVMDFGETKEGLLYLVMDLVEGPELAHVIADEAPFSAERARNIFRQLCLGLSHAHEEGLVHRDFKGENVILSQRGQQDVPRIVDFGIAIMLEDTESRLTTQGVIIGTPAYMSPEQVMGRTLDHRSDLFSLGVLLYEMLAGVQPFDGDPMGIARQNMSSEAPPISERVPGLEVDPQLERIAHKLMAKKPEDRFQSADEIVAALDSQQATLAAAADVSVKDMLAQSKSGRTPLLVGAVAVGLIAVIGSLVLLGGGGRETDAVTAAPSPEDAGPSAVLSPPPTDAASVADQAPVDIVPPRVDVDAALPAPDRGVRRRDRTTVPTETAPRVAETSKQPAARPPEETRAPEKAKVPEEPAAPPTSKAITRLYVSVGESIQKLQSSQPDRVAHYRKQYSAIPFNDALRVPAMRKEVEAKLRRLSNALNKELTP